jgi:hypothetical protein
VGWALVLGLLGTALFCWVAVHSSAPTAFNVLTQHQSPTNAALGVAGYSLGVFGYFVASAAIGALVAGVYTTNSAMSGRRIRKRLKKTQRKAASEPGPIGRTVRALAGRDRQPRRPG